MKIKLFALLIMISFEYQNVGSQKYRTLKEYQEYFISNYQTIDKIEGIWYEQHTLTINENSNNSDPKINVIVKEGTSYIQYTFENGYYLPTSGTKEFNFTTSGYQYKRYFEEINKNLYGEPFYLYNNNKKFSFELGAKDLMRADAKKNGQDPNIIRNSYFNFSYSKYFPLESDIINKDNQEKSNSSSGTGFAISSNGMIATNYHVIDGAKKIEVRCANFSYSAEVIISDPKNDLAIIKINDLRFKSLGILPFGLKNNLADVGESIFVLGYPLTASMGTEVKLTNGIISSKTGFQGDVSSYQISAPVQPGNSGGPLFDNSGNIIGIVNAKYINAENVSYAIKINYLQNLIELLNNHPNLLITNLLAYKTLPEKIKTLRNFVYIITVNDFSTTSSTNISTNTDNQSSFQDTNKNAKLYFDKAVEETKFNDFKRALDYINRSLDYDNQNLDAYFYRGYCKSNLDDDLGAIKDYDFIINNRGEKSLKTDIAIVFNNKAYCLCKLGKNESALVLANKAISINDKIGFIWDTRGEIYYNIGQYENSIYDMNRAIDLNFRSSNSYYIKGLSEIKLGHKDEGCLDLNNAFELGKTDAKNSIDINCK